jgi:glycosyltransferase involved in cell wall biosynthesis
MYQGSEKTEAKVLVSVVIPTYNGAETLELQLLSLSKQSFELPFEVIISDNRSTDGTKEIALTFIKTHPTFRYVEANERQGVNHARNRGAQSAVGLFILLCDSDDVVGLDWVSKHYAAFASGADLVGGVLMNYANNVFMGSTGLNSNLWGVNLSFPSGANCGFTKLAYEKVLGFDESYLGGGDEAEFFWRAQIAGFELVFVENATVTYRLREGSKSIACQKYAYGLSHTKLYSQFKSFGMPKSSATRSVASFLKALLLCLAKYATGRSSSRELGVLALHLGRLRGSCKYRVFYF